jgi:hypothetical protein
VRRFEIALVEVRVEPHGDGSDRVCQGGVERSAGGRELRWPWSVGAAARDQTTGLESVEQLGGARAIEAELRLIGEQVALRR